MKWLLKSQKKKLFPAAVPKDGEVMVVEKAREGAVLRHAPLPGDTSTGTGTGTAKLRIIVIEPREMSWHSRLSMNTGKLVSNC
jgi:hypothetical protein